MELFEAQNDETVLIQDYTNLMNDGGLFPLIFITCLSSLLILSCLVSCLKSARKTSSFMFLALSAIGLVGCIFLLITTNNENLKRLDHNNEAVKEIAYDKYNVEILENFTKYKDNEKRYVANYGPLKANNPNGDRIQVFLEVTEDNKDILLFSNGKELPVKSNTD